MLSIFPIPAFNDNYIWILVDEVNQYAIVVDPGDATPVLAFLQQRQLTLSAILITHKHHDHTGGIVALLSVFPNTQVFSHPLEKVMQTTHPVSDNDVISIHDNDFSVMCIPGHTLGHVAYYCSPILFCGDTLFANGCGRVFEGTAEQMLQSLQKLMTLPDETKVYCGHEYTVSNIAFALHVEPNNIALQKRFETAKQLRSNHQPTVPSTMALEKLTNPFLRTHVSSVMDAISKKAGRVLDSDVAVFAALREWKNAF